MTLDLTKFISNSITKQAKIQHLDINTKTVATDDIPDSVKKLINKQYGKKYLLDADYTAFFWGALDKDNIEKLFKIVDTALGKSANRLTNTDFKKINIDIDKTEDLEDDQSEEDNDKPEDAEEPIEDEVEEVIDDTDEDGAADIEKETADDEALNEDDEDLEVSIEETPAAEAPVKTSYFFLKITMK